MPDMTQNLIDNDNCQRCGVPVKFECFADDDSPVYVDADGYYVCTDYHGHDEHGVYSPLHTLHPDDDSTVVTDNSDGCYFDEDLDEWVVDLPTSRLFTP